MGPGKLQRLSQEAREFFFAHLTRSHGELAVLDRAAAADVPVYLDVVRGIGEHCRRFCGAENGIVRRRG